MAVSLQVPPGLGLAGVVVSPSSDGGAGSGGAVIVLGGSEGGFREADARAFADAGFMALALAYFGADGVPPVLRDVPLEYSSAAVTFLTGLGHDRVGIVGGSRGGEAALLAGAHDGRVSAVVSVAGSGVVIPGIDFRLGGLAEILSTRTDAWTIGGVAVPALPYAVSASTRAMLAAGAPVRLAQMFAPLPRGAALERVSIPVERITGPVLLISGGDDGMWHSTAYSEVAAARLQTAAHPYPWEHLILDGAGHTIAGPPGAAFTTSTAPGPGVTFEMGGDPVVTTAARATAWHRTIEFLTDHLR